VLFALEENVAVIGTATFTQTGGTNEVDTLFLGRNLGSTGTYTISGGVLSSPTVCVGYDGAGTLSITGAAAQISVSNFLRFGADSTFTSVPGGTIHMTGAALENLSTAPADLAGLANLTLIFEGGTGVTDDFEAAGQDKGADLSGWTANFALGTLQLGGAAAGRVALVDTFDNQPGWVGDEALYTDTLIMNAGATIDPGGLNLYYLNGGGPKQFFRGDAKLDGNVDVLDLAALGNNFESTGATWAKADFNGDELVDVLDLAILANNFGSETGGSVGTPIPEPASASLVAVGLGVLLARRRRRRAPADYRILKRPVQPVE